jgi:hypothetical protein
MWKTYFGPTARIYGVDIESACHVYNDDQTKIFIGDQADRAFWNQFRREVPTLDIVIDDGGHAPEQQRVTFEELMPHLRAGGVYVCEDVHGPKNPFAWYIQGFSNKLNVTAGWRENFDDRERRIVADRTDVQRAIQSIHLYPFVAVAERTTSAIDELQAAKHGTSWQPYLS